MTDQIQKCLDFQKLHTSPGTFIIPNPWDIGSARLMQGLGFSALATTSAGLAHTLGRSDGEVALEEKLVHCAQLASATDIPINADFENGFSEDIAELSLNIKKVIETGVAGCSIEDFSRESKTIYDFNHAVDRVHAAAEVVAESRMAFQLTARAENLLRGIQNVDDTIRRLQAYSEAGAQVLYAPGINSLQQLKQVTDEIDKPFNVLAPFFKDATVDDFGIAGAKRISVGGALNWITVSPLLKAGKEMLELGTFNWTSEMAEGKEVQKLLG